MYTYYMHHARHVPPRTIKEEQERKCDTMRVMSTGTYVHIYNYELYATTIYTYCNVTTTIGSVIHHYNC